MTIKIFCVSLLLTLGSALFPPVSVFATESGLSVSSSTNEQIVVGTRIAPPFVIQDDDGTLHGLSVSLWKHIAGEMDLDYRFELMEITEMIEAATNGDVFASVSALTITAEREEVVDFSHPFFVSGYGIAVNYVPQGIWQAFLAIFSTDFLYVTGLLVLVLLFWGALVWYFEHKNNPDEFGGSTAEGIGSGFWWAAVTMTTVGYGDKSPRTIGGRVVGFIWMFAAIIVISFFTASIASSLTVTQLDSRVSGAEDLPFVRVGTLSQSATTGALDDLNVRYTLFDSIPEGLQAVSDNRIDAFVHDAPIIRYLAETEFRNEVQVLPSTFNIQYLGIAMPRDAEYRNTINTLLLEYIQSEAWSSSLREYGLD
ncbi:MAG: transporter substrate-binding domain-containing protein [Balneolales bacterium]|nr:transporter substrate-binding domain-containing protein [Balneolales bacterium]